MQIAPVLACAALAIFLEKGLQQTEVVGLRAEVADMPPLLPGLADSHVHLGPGVAVKTVPSTTAALYPSWWNMERKALVEVEVPAPDEPVTAMMGCLADIEFSSLGVPL